MYVIEVAEKRPVSSLLVLSRPTAFAENLKFVKYGDITNSSPSAQAQSPPPSAILGQDGMRSADKATVTLLTSH